MNIFRMKIPQQYSSDKRKIIGINFPLIVIMLGEYFLPLLVVWFSFAIYESTFVVVPIIMCIFYADTWLELLPLISHYIFLFTKWCNENSSIVSFSYYSPELTWNDLGSNLIGLLLMCKIVGRVNSYNRFKYIFYTMMLHWFPSTTQHGWLLSIEIGVVIFVLQQIMHSQTAMISVVLMRMVHYAPRSNKIESIVYGLYQILSSEEDVANDKILKFIALILMIIKTDCSVPDNIRMAFAQFMAQNYKIRLIASQDNKYIVINGCVDQKSDNDIPNISSFLLLVERYNPAIKFISYKIESKQLTKEEQGGCGLCHEHKDKMIKYEGLEEALCLSCYAKTQERDVKVPQLFWMDLLEGSS